MLLSNFFPAIRLAALVLLGVAVVPSVAPTAQGQEVNVYAQDTEVLTRGAIHDAFAIPVGLDPVAGPIVPREPPADIEELPPEVAVEDPNAEWITGYWSWDEEREDFVWTSGVWRVAPPNHRWVAGYWTQVTTDTGAMGFQRVSGFWAPNEVRQVVYYPQPPASLEAGPNVPQPSPDHFWIPGSWVNTDGRYVWRGGYWAASQQNWVWMPAYYVRTPGGYIYNAGYWDYPFDNRGMIFAPVYFSNNVYTRPGFRYSPAVLIRATQLLVHLFARPTYGNYYFGDYYGPTYATAGYTPWFAARGRGDNQRWYDPIYVYQRSHHRGDADWSRRWQDQYDYYTANQDARPRRTYSAERQFASAQGPNRDRSEFRNAILATSVADVVNNIGNTNVVNNTVIKNVTNVNIRRVQNDERVAIEKRSQEVKQFAKQRSQVEREARVAGNENRGPRNGAGPGAGQNRPGNPNQPGGQVAAGPIGATLTLPEVTNPKRVNVGFGPREGANRDPNVNTPRTDNGPRPDRGDRPNQPGFNLPALNQPNPNRPGENRPGPNVNRPDADNPQTGRPTPMPGGPRPGGREPSGPNTGIVPTPRATPSATPGTTRLPQIPIAPGTGDLPRAPRGNQPGGPNVPGRADPAVPGATPMPTPKLPDQPRNPRFNQPRTEPPRNVQPKNDPPKTEQPRVGQPGGGKPGAGQPGGPRGGVPGLGLPPNRGNNPGGDNPARGNPGRGERPNVGQPAGPAPGAAREQPKPEMRQRPQQSERPPQTDRPPKVERQPKNDAPQAGPKPERGPRADKPDDDKPKGPKPEGTKPEKKEKK